MQPKHESKISLKVSLPYEVAAPCVCMVLYGDYDCPGLKIHSSVSVRAVYCLLPHMRPLLTSQDYGIEPATYNT